MPVSSFLSIRAQLCKKCNKISKNDTQKSKTRHSTALWGISSLHPEAGEPFIFFSSKVRESQQAVPVPVLPLVQSHMIHSYNFQMSSVQGIYKP